MKNQTSSASEQHQNHQKRYDYIIVGGGPSALGLLYGLLSSNSNKKKKFSVCLIEEGPDRAPSMSNHAKHWFRDSHLRYENEKSCCLKSVPQRGLNHRVLDIPVGRGLGGGSNVNACLLTKPDFQNDFRTWPDVWSDGSRIQKSCEVIEKAMNRNGGVTTFSYCEKFHELTSNQVMPLCSIPDHNYDHENNDKTQTHAAVVDAGEKMLKIKFCSTIQLTTTSKGIRVNYFESLVQPLCSDDRVTFLTNTRVHRVLWCNCDDDDANVPNTGKRSCTRKAIGVECFQITTSSNVVINADKEIILCAGAIHSPVILMRSGIGEKAVLSKLQCADEDQQFHDLPSVGKNLRDHVLFSRAYFTLPQWHCKQSIMGCQGWYLINVAANMSRPNNINDASKSSTLIQICLDDGCVIPELLPTMTSNVLRKTYSSKPWTQFFCMLHNILHGTLNFSVWYTPLRWIIEYMTGFMIICILNPKSKGSVSLSSDGDVLVDPGYLTDVSDVEKVLDAWQVTDGIIGRRHFSRNCFEILPGPFFKVISIIMSFCASTEKGTQSKDQTKQQKEEDIISFARNFSCPYFHWVGSCAMGSPNMSNKNENGFVVDESFRVRGMQGLRVCDASTFPSCISGPTALTCASIGHVGSTFLLEEMD